ncbi:MAG: GNAT family N-acetyltransferase [Acidimicrobiales bacterium]
MRPARAADAGAIAGLVAATGGHDAAAGNPGTLRELNTTLPDPRSRCMVATAEDGEVIGYVEIQARACVAYGTREAWVSMLAVAPAWRGQGTGSALLAEAPEPGDQLPPLPEGYERLRVSGSATVDLCRVADGAAGVFWGLNRRVAYLHDVAGAMAILLEAGASVLDSEGAVPVLLPSAGGIRPVVAAPSEEEARRLLADLPAPLSRSVS